MYMAHLGCSRGVLIGRGKANDDILPNAPVGINGGAHAHDATRHLLDCRGVTLECLRDQALHLGKQRESWAERLYKL